ncbi:cobalamin biosynthesis protein CbiX [Corticibacter populi]|uniref:Cobalamin biosynthesis protein CbiX n=1 Tax=Corticibacter populi TaxID=1550736 RepID=A0A3M6QT08_9BURK|nr:CbiX/SirB N-terminal domain-containing protein [Corticibacter populi]RMX05991.1 cobalamin biosynthesis protein CbiX [Corticibacter populi]RZS30678.1 sirohydrochlorin cobaltochelatase [Corticibacter populi]
MTVPVFSTAITAIILLGHGSRDPVWHEPMQRMAQAIAAREPQRPVACAYLELSEPDVFAATEALLREQPSIRRVVLYPVFIGMGLHARQDLPRLQQELGGRYAGIAFELAPALGTDERLIELVAALAIEAAH